MANRGVAAKDIKAILEEDALDASIYIMVDTLKYLKKGGRVTPAAAMIGTVLNIKLLLRNGDSLVVDNLHFSFVVLGQHGRCITGGGKAA